MAIPDNTLSAQTLSNEQLVLLLIGEELKSRKFFNTLQELGLDNSQYQPNLDDAILSCIGLSDNSNETLDFYYATMEKHASRIEGNRQSIETEAVKVYQVLMEEKNRKNVC